MPRDLTKQEIDLTQADIAFKHMLLNEVEATMKRVGPALFDTLIEQKLGQWIDDTVSVVNYLEQRIIHLEKLLDVNLPNHEGATDDIPQPAEPAPDAHLDDVGD